MRFKKIYVEITNNCNLKCDFCIKNKREQKYITIDIFKCLLDKIKDYTEYLYFHILGEPLMHPHINELINIASNNFKVNITTNGYLINCIKNNKNIRQLNISLHSYSDKYKSDLKTYLTNIFDSVDVLLENKTYVSLRLWVNNKFHQDIIKYINQRYNCNIPKDIDNFTIKENLFINNFHEFIWPDLNNSYYSVNGTCYALKDQIGILVDGTVVPCCLDTLGTINLGNIYKQSLQDILKQERVQDMLDNFKRHKKCEELCKHCHFIDKY